jgi:DNA-binding MurR/RpiR family transcriptional regulator
VRHRSSARKRREPLDQLLRRTDRRAGSAGARVLRFIDENREVVLASSAAELGARLGTSDATVIRTIQALGFAGLNELKQAILDSLASAATPANEMRRSLAELEQSTGDALDSVLQAHQESVDVIRSNACRAQVAAGVHRLSAAQRIVVFGIGPSSALASYVTTLLRRTGRESWTLNTTGAMLADQMLSLRKGDALLVLAYGRLYKEVTAIFAEAKALGLPTVLITEAGGTRLAKTADVTIVVPRGHPGKIALHGATLVALESIVFSLAAATPRVALQSLGRLAELRCAIEGVKHAASP